MIELVSGSSRVSVEEEIGRIADAVASIRTRITRMKTTLVEPLGRIIDQAVMERFEFGGSAFGDFGTDWEPLKETTIGIRQSRGQWPGAGGSQPILRATKTLQRSMGIFHGTGRTILTYGTRLRYAAVHEFGSVSNTDIYVHAFDQKTGRHKKVKIPAGTVTPARPALYLNEQMLQEMEQTILEYVMERFDRLDVVGEQIVQEFGN